MNTNNLRLLIVDDEEAARYGMRRALQTFGCDIAEAESAESAHALMRTSKFDLLLLDVNLPGLSGLDFLRQIQSEAENSKTMAPHVVIITAHGSERLAVEAAHRSDRCQGRWRRPQPGDGPGSPTARG